MNPTPAQLEALKAAGGCDHQFNPFVPCGVCRRPAIGGDYAAVDAVSFVAELQNGTMIHCHDRPSVSHLPLDAVKRLVVVVRGVAIPGQRITLDVDPDKGERLFRFARPCVRVGVGDGKPRGGLRVEVFEVRRDDGSFVRLYIHPTEGLILSTKDIYF